MDVVRGGKARGAARDGSTRESIADRPGGRNTEIGPRYDAPMRSVLLAAGVLVTLSGLVWLAQGLDLPFAPRSFMTADRSWAFIGAVTAAAGMVLVVRGRRTR